MKLTIVRHGQTEENLNQIVHYETVKPQLDKLLKPKR